MKIKELRYKVTMLQKIHFFLTKLQGSEEKENIFAFCAKKHQPFEAAKR